MNNEAGGRVPGQGDSLEGLPFVNLPPLGPGAWLVVRGPAAAAAGLPSVKKTVPERASVWIFF